METPINQNIGHLSTVMKPQPHPLTGRSVLHMYQPNAEITQLFNRIMLSYYVTDIVFVLLFDPSWFWTIHHMCPIITSMLSLCWGYGESYMMVCAFCADITQPLNTVRASAAFAFVHVLIRGE